MNVTNLIAPVTKLRFEFSEFVEKSDPAGQVPPKFPRSSKSRSDSFEMKANTTLSILCDAQAFPAPSFRSVLSFSF